MHWSFASHSTGMQQLPAMHIRQKTACDPAARQALLRPLHRLVLGMCARMVGRTWHSSRPLGSSWAATSSRASRGAASPSSAAQTTRACTRSGCFHGNLKLNLDHLRLPMYGCYHPNTP